MKYYNIKNKDIRVSFREAVTQGISSDMGLFMPERIPSLSKNFFRHLPDMDFPSIAFTVASEYIGDDIPSQELKDICHSAFNFPVPLKQINERKYVLELFHGPTAAFKDFGARFMSQCFRYFSASDDRPTVVLVATSGDTGGAIANSFLGIDGTEVIILYPSGKVSDLQEKQLTTLGQNITAIEVTGTFDDCQSMVKQAFTRLNVKNRIRLTSANSINIARLIPQSFYYYYAASRLNNVVPVFSVPSGNFGNMTGAMLAWKTGLAVERFIASTNINRVVPDYLKTGDYVPRKSVLTIANAMDVGNPSNFDRIKDLFGNSYDEITSMVDGEWFDDEAIKHYIREEFRSTGYVLDPHGAVASMGLDAYMKQHPDSTGIFVETAHPAKFKDIVEPLTGSSAEIPESLKNINLRGKISVLMNPDYGSLERFLTEKYSL